MKKRNIIISIVGIFLLSISTAYAVTIIKASDVTYDTSKSNGSSNNVQGAIDELYYKFGLEKNNEPSPPKINDNGKLIPVRISNDGTVKKINKDDKTWYNYSAKEWANAVILVDTPSKTYKEGETILESDIESYFVWIPKYKYKLWNVETISSSEINPKHVIDIIFDENDTKDIEGYSCKTPMTSGSAGNCNNGEYMTHPAFITFGVDGFWVGKFETGYKGATSTTKAQVNSSDSSKIIIKPNVYSWRSNSVYNFFVSAYNYERSLDSHMIKNTEWGAVSYLSHSKYGIGYEININNNSSFKTGYSALLTTNQTEFQGEFGDGDNYNKPYNTVTGYLASTTGNITGIYDMSGGAHEFMASYTDGQYGKSGFTGTTIASYNARYFDKYNLNSTTSNFRYRILGDATGELSPYRSYADKDNFVRTHSSWYENHAGFVNTSLPWFVRGGFFDHGILAGQFSFTRDEGADHSVFSSRIVLTGS